MTDGTLLPPGASRDARLLLTARGLRAFADGFISLLLPFYLTAIGFQPFEVGAITTATLLGSGVLTLLIGLYAHRLGLGRLLTAAALLMFATGAGFASFSGFWPLLVVAAVGPMNPSAGDVSVFLPLEQTLLARAADDRRRTALFARYNLVGALVGALGALAAGLPALLAQLSGIDPMDSLKAMFWLYGGVGLAVLLIYRQLGPRAGGTAAPAAAPLGRSRRIVYTLAALFSVDAFAGGLAVQSLLALWLLQRFDLSIEATASIFFWAGLLTALSFLAAAPLARRIGLINTMVFTHLPSNVFLMLVPLMPNLPLALLFLLLRSALSSMDVPARSSYVMAIVTPGERPAAASVTAVPRSLASSLGPLLAGYLLGVSAFGWPLVLCGALKIGYDLALLKMFRALRPPEERDSAP